VAIKIIFVAGLPLFAFFYCSKPFEMPRLKELLVVDDHVLLLEGLKLLFANHEKAIVKDTAQSGPEALEKLRTSSYDFILLDISMPGMNGIETLIEIRNRKITTPVIMLTMHHDFTSAAGAIHSGANGYILKDRCLEEIVTALEVIDLGGMFISNEIRDMLVEMNNLNKDLSLLPNPYAILSERELQIAKLFAEGKTSNEIAAQLFLSPTTVDTHRRNIFSKLKINKTATLVKYIYENDLN
jgi:DNA-binding NarL/FixJ family response regulator